MLRYFLLLLVFLSPFSFSDENVYYLGAGDTISISVYDEPDLSLVMKIGLSGSISYPLLGDVSVVGMSPKQLENLLVERLKGPYLVDPSVSVSIEEYRPFYVTGEVEKPGSYPFHPGLTIDRAVSIAGGFTDRGSKSRIYVVRERNAESGSLTIQKEKTGLLDMVKPGDVITVEQGFF